MGRNKFSEREIKIIGKLLGRKMAGNRSQHKLVRHTLRTVFDFNIADINVQEDTIEQMKLRYAEKRQHEEALQQAEAVADGEVVDWQEVQRQWDEYYAQHPEEQCS